MAPNARQSTRAPDPERDKFLEWRRLRPQPGCPNDSTTDLFFRRAAQLVESDATMAQQVIKELATDTNLLVIRDMVHDLTPHKSPSQKVKLWLLRVLPFFHTILHEDIIESVVLEQEISIIYRTLLGLDATRLKHFFKFIIHVIDHWIKLPFPDPPTSSLEALSLSCGVLAKTIDTSSANVVNAHFESIARDLRLRCDVFGSGTEDFHFLQAKRYLEYICRRLKFGQLIPEAPSGNFQAKGAAAAFKLSQDLPGALSRHGRRHDNDHADIENIKLMPTYEEILSCRDEYLPTTNPSQHHIQGLRGLLDRHFRLIREDTLHDLRNTIRIRLESNKREAEVHTKIIGYDNATAVDVAFDRFTGLEFTIRIDQPQGARGLDKSHRVACGHNILLLSDSDSERDEFPEEFTSTATGLERQRYSVLGDGDKEHKGDGKPKKTQAEVEIQKDQAESLPLTYGQDSNEEDFLADSAAEEELVNDIVKLLPDRPRADSPTLGTDGAVIRRNCRYKSHGKAFHYH
ncbi:hypothetical protein MCOR02_005220 [Pyricularia oryzae]|nr:hypothetical protein MCOR02_005220 [Pyricularia oryzae]